MDVFTAEDQASWTEFLRSLVERGLSGVLLVITDAHPGLKAAIAEVLPGAGWQRCRTHFARNLLCRVPKAAQGVVAGMLRLISAQPDAEQLRAQYRRVVEHLMDRFPAAGRLLDGAEAELLALADFPKAHWR